MAPGHASELDSNLDLIQTTQRARISSAVQHYVHRFKNPNSWLPLPTFRIPVLSNERRFHIHHLPFALRENNMLWWHWRLPYFCDAIKVFMEGFNYVCHSSCSVDFVARHPMLPCLRRTSGTRCYHVQINKTGFLPSTREKEKEKRFLLLPHFWVEYVIMFKFRTKQNQNKRIMKAQ